MRRNFYDLWGWSGDVDFIKLLNFHNSHKKITTVTAVHPPVRFEAA